MTSVTMNWFGARGSFVLAVHGTGMCVVLVYMYMQKRMVIMSPVG